MPSRNMRAIKYTDPHGESDILRSAPDVVKHIKVVIDQDVSEYFVKKTAAQNGELAGFQLSYATDEEWQRHQRGLSAGYVEVNAESEADIQNGAIELADAVDGDRLAEGLISFGIGVIVMDRHDTPVPHGYFFATAMCQRAGKLPGNFLSSPSTINVVTLLSKELRLTYGKVVPTFTQGPYKGTWIHRDLATNLAMYCDRTGALQLAVSKAIRALADRPPVAAATAPPTAPTVPLSEQGKALGLVHVATAEAQAIAIKGDAVAAAEEKTFAVRVKQAELEERRLAVAKQYTKLERSHLKDIGNITISNIERQAAVKRKQQAETDENERKRMKQLRALYAAAQAKKDKQKRLCAVPTGSLLDCHGRATGKMVPTSFSASSTFALREAVEEAARQMSVPRGAVYEFMSKGTPGGKSPYQNVITGAKLKWKGKVVTVTQKHGRNDCGVYCKSGFAAAVAWIKAEYKKKKQIQLPACAPRK